MANALDTSKKPATAPKKAPTDNSKNKTIGRQSMALALGDPSMHTPETFRNLIDAQTQIQHTDGTPLLDPKTAASWKANVPQNATPDQIKTLLMQHAYMASDPEFAQTMGAMQHARITGMTQ